MKETKIFYMQEILLAKNPKILDKNFNSLRF